MVHTMLDAAPPGSYSAMWDGTDTSDAIRAALAAHAEMDSPYRLSTIPDLRECFAGLEMVPPGLLAVSQWRPEHLDIAASKPSTDSAGWGSNADRPPHSGDQHAPSPTPPELPQRSRSGSLRIGRMG